MYTFYPLWAAPFYARNWTNWQEITIHKLFTPVFVTALCVLTSRGREEKLLLVVKLLSCCHIFVFLEMTCRTLGIFYSVLRSFTGIGRHLKKDTPTVLQTTSSHMLWEMSKELCLQYKMTSFSPTVIWCINTSDREQKISFPFFAFQWTASKIFWAESSCT